MELINNLFQFAVTLLGFCLSGIWYLKDRKQTCFLLTCFYGCFALGSLYWTLYLLLFSETPQVFYVSEFGWIASVIFLYLLQYTLSSAEERDFSTRKSQIAQLICISLCNSSQISKYLSQYSFCICLAGVLLFLTCFIGISGFKIGFARTNKEGSLNKN